MTRWAFLAIFMLSAVSGQSTQSSNVQQIEEHEGNAYWWLFFVAVLLFLIIGAVLAILCYRARARRARLLKQKAKYTTTEIPTHLSNTQFQLPIVMRQESAIAGACVNVEGNKLITSPQDADATSSDVSGIRILNRRFSAEGPEFDEKTITRCVMCLQQERNVMFYDCMHISCCESCATTLLQTNPVCPRCREAIIKMDVVKVKSQNVIS